MVKSPLRYPGGKLRALRYILPNIPDDIEEFREPMVGGGVVALNVQRMYPHVRVWINDLNEDLICFWTTLRDHPKELIEEIMRIKRSPQTSRQLYKTLEHQTVNTTFERALRFFILNRLSYGGKGTVGGFAPHALRRFINAKRLEQELWTAAQLIKDFKITHGDYEKVIREDGSRVFIFLDPPYFMQSEYYETPGNFDTPFGHERFAENMKQCPHMWLVTYNDCAQVRSLFSFAHVYAGAWLHCMGFRRQERQLLISNYPLPYPPQQNNDSFDTVDKLDNR